MKRLLLRLFEFVTAGVAWLMAWIAMWLPWRVRCACSRALMAVLDVALSSRALLRLAVKTRWRS